jgi:hypothetical protein
MNRRRELALLLLIASPFLFRGCGGEKKPNLKAEDYDRSCTAAEGCTLVPIGDVCHPCAGSHLASLSLTGKQLYDADVQAIDCSKYDYSGGIDACEPPPKVKPACQDGTCGMEAAQCGDGACDYQWGGETALTCADDCSCGDGICDSSEEEGAVNECLQDCAP